MNPNLWCGTFETSLLEVVFVATKPDTGAYTYGSGEALVIFIFLYIDDILFTGRKAALVQKVKLELVACYFMVDL